jgi:hypothetical protein
LPNALLSFLSASHIRKVGVQVTADLKRLFKDCGYIEGRDQPFVGALELGRMAKECGAASKANIGLADLCGSVLKRFLPKDPDIRISALWNIDPLPSSHSDYAALDVYAAWKVFHTLTSSTFGDLVDISTPGGTAVALFSSDNSRAVAYGTIALERPPKYLGVNVTKTRILLNVNEILAPGYLISEDLLPGKDNLPLSAFLPAPFTILCKAKHLRIRHNTLPIQASVKPTPSLPKTKDVSAPPIPVSQEANDKTTDSAVTEDGGTPWYAEADNDSPLADEQVVNSSIRDPISHSKACKLLNSHGLGPTGTVLRSRVLGDIWHLMHQFPISQAHGLRRPFARALRNAFFEYDSEDKADLEAFFKSKGVTWEFMMRNFPTWVLQRVRRFVPPPEDLLPRVLQVLYDFGPLLCAKSRQSLFNDKAWEISTNALENIRQGLYSDPPDTQLYYLTGKDKYGLHTYRCCRGTNTIEGGVHQNIIRWFGAFNAAPDFAVELLRDYTLYHNLKVMYFY